MDSCDALIVGGGPAGSTCAWKLREAGLDVLVVDKAAFPRDKVCAGWMTPQTVTDLRLDLDEYGSGRTLQPITGFRVAVIGGTTVVETSYARTVSYGIRRSEFDQYLLARSRARTWLGTPISSLRRSGGDWIVNESVRSPVLVGAGGHFCPVARRLNGSIDDAPLVAAQEAECLAASIDGASSPIERGVPELYFCPDMKGYGWCIRKGAYLNIGLGRLDRHALPAAVNEFVAFLKARQRVPPRASWRWRGHAYAVLDSAPRRLMDGNAILVGDAAGLASPRSGEGIRPAIESGLLAAATIIDANGHYTGGRLDGYVDRIRARFGSGRVERALRRFLPAALERAMIAGLLQRPAFVRHVVLDRWFLHVGEPALAV
ncbi:MAG: NAD(P)/FAD-dependent oxidoreductase [Vicinamibacterales bacterium]